MTPAKKGESALGMGLDALIRKEKPTDQDEVKEKPSIKNKAPNKTPTKSKKPEKGQSEVDLNKPIIEGVVLEVRKNPRISLWSAKSAAVLRYLKNTKPAFSISKEASALIEEAVQQKYPEIWGMFQDEDF
jgi:hypothetical protein